MENTNIAEIGNPKHTNHHRDWRPEWLCRRHRIKPAQASAYLDWAQPRWEVKA